MTHEKPKSHPVRTCTPIQQRGLLTQYTSTYYHTTHEPSVEEITKAHTACCINTTAETTNGEADRGVNAPNPTLYCETHPSNRKGELPKHTV